MPDIEIDNLVINNKISIRSSNICKGIGLNMLSEIILYFQQKNNFHKIQNCGVKSNEELVRLCEYHIEAGTIELQLQNAQFNLDGLIAESYSLKFDQLSSYKKALFKQKLNFFVLALCNRSRNGLLNHFNELSSDDDLKKILSNSTNFSSIKNIGQKSLIELNELRGKAIKFIDELSNMPDVINENNHTEEFIQTVLLKLPLLQEDCSNYLNEYGKLKLFKFLKYLTDSSILLKDKEKTAFASLFTNDPFVEFSNEEIAELLNCTKERFRQIKVRVEKSMEAYFEFIEKISINEIINYDFNLESNFIVVDDKLCNHINTEEDVNFNKLFINFIFHIFFKKIYIGFGQQLNFKNSYKKHNYFSFNSNYYISKTLCNAFDFGLFFIEIENLITTSRSKSELVNLRAYIIKYFKGTQSIKIDELLEILKTILTKEFDIKFSVDDNAILVPNKKKKVHEYYYSIIESNNNPMRISGIVSIANKLYPFLNSTDESVRGILGREKDKFIYFGRSSTYGLRVWEKQKDGIKGGTIKNIVEEYLESQVGPKSISEILNYVNQFRKTNEKSVLTNLKLDNTNKFIFYKGEIVGLANRHLETLEFKLLEAKNTWRERYNWLVQFKIENGNKLPSAVSKDYKERGAYNLLYKSKKNFQNGTLSKEKEDLIRALGNYLDAK